MNQFTTIHDIDLSQPPDNLVGKLHRITVEYPLSPREGGGKHPGGRALRKSRLRKKQRKYKQSVGHFFELNGYVSSVDYAFSSDGMVTNTGWSPTNRPTREAVGSEF